MKARTLIFFLALTAIIVALWLPGWHNAITMALVGSFAFSAGIISWLLFVPGKSIMMHSGEHYRIGRTTKGVRIENPDGRVILDRIVVRAGFRNSRDKVVRTCFKLSGVEFNDETMTLTQQHTSPLMEIRIGLQLKKQDPSINLTASGTIRLNIPHNLLHHDGHLRLEFLEVGLMFPNDLPIRELYLKNRTRRTSPSLGWVWLDKQGVSIGKGSRRFHMYHVPGISSIRYRRFPHTLSVFLDHAADHHFTTASASETQPEYYDNSTSICKPGDKFSGTVVMLIGKAPLVQPLIWMHPKGHDATLIWTSHPDNGTLNTNKAVTLGDSALEPDEMPTGGFTAHGIPMTMGVFNTSAHPRHIALFNHPDADQYRHLVSSLRNQHGFEIALHTASDQCSTRKETETALAYVSQELGVFTWIDHSANLQRASLSGSGTRCTDEHYILDLLAQHGIRYAWHYGSELKYLKDYDIHDDAHGLDCLQTGRRSVRACHTPLFWKHPTRLGHLISWKTMALGRLRHFPMTGLHWLIWVGRNLKPLISHHGAAIIHDYPFWRYTKKHQNGNGIYCKAEETDRWVIDPDFNLLLQTLATYQHQQKVHCSTLHAFVDYQIKAEKIRFEFIDPRTTRIVNTSTDAVDLVLAFPANTTPRGEYLTKIRLSGDIQLHLLNLPPLTERVIMAD